MEQGGKYGCDLNFLRKDDMARKWLLGPHDTLDWIVLRGCEAAKVIVLQLKPRS